MYAIFEFSVSIMAGNKCYLQSAKNLLAYAIYSGKVDDGHMDRIRC